MTLIELKHHLQTVRIATLTGLCALFKMDAAAMQAMLEFWMRKGMVKHCDDPTSCQRACTTCVQCGTKQQSYYEWTAS